eukprot:m.54671 g.54671  ORF g.54671 m.54671 type:complete len:573 (+) comp10941_c0_seq1:70-1788(+)
MPLPNTTDSGFSVERYEQLKQAAAESWENLTCRMPALVQYDCNGLYKRFFSPAFSSYAALNKFQTSFRQELTGQCGFTRWDAGIICVRIGELYFEFYLHSGDNRFLSAAYRWYSHTLERGYFDNSHGLEKAHKTIRYLMRYFLVAHILGKYDYIREKLMPILNSEIQGFQSSYPESDLVDSHRASMVELDYLTKSAKVVFLVDASNQQIHLRPDARLLVNWANQPGESELTLQDGIIACGYQELLASRQNNITIEALRILQVLEHRVIAESSPKPSDAYIDGSNLRRQPHKYMLHNPEASSVLTHIQWANMELPPHGILFLYLRGDAYRRSQSSTSTFLTGVSFETQQSHDSDTPMGGEFHSKQTSSSQPNFSGVSGIFPGDMLPFMRNPLFLVVDSAAAGEFSTLESTFGIPFLALLSPEQCPEVYDTKFVGSLLSLFLQSPLEGFCFVSFLGLQDVPLGISLWTSSLSIWNSTYREIESLLSNPTFFDTSVQRLCGDQFLRRIVIHFIFFHETLNAHVAFQGSQFLPKATKGLDLLQIASSGVVRQCICTLAGALKVTSLYNFEQTTSDQ